MKLRTGIAEEINKHHEIAIARANEAIEHAEQAGKLLLEVKASLPHGQFIGWVEQNIRVSARQAQRYMAVAQGKPAPIRALAGKNDTVSHLPEPDTDAVSGLPVPTWWPLPGHWMTTVVEGAAYWVVPSLTNPGFFHISKWYSLPPQERAGDAPPDWDGASMFDGTRRPVRADAVEAFLKHFGLADPAGASWQARKKEGLLRPFGEPDEG